MQSEFWHKYQENPEAATDYFYKFSQDNNYIRSYHIKKENIGLIEVMGLAVLPARLKNELELLAQYILDNKDIASCPQIKKHAD